MGTFQVGLLLIGTFALLLALYCVAQRLQNICHCHALLLLALFYRREVCLSSKLGFTSVLYRATLMLHCAFLEEVAFGTALTLYEYLLYTFLPFTVLYALILYE